MKLLYHSLALYLAFLPRVYSAPKEVKSDDKPCTITSPYTHSFFDLTSLRIPDPESSSKSNPQHTSWNATGYDLPYNFTVNICGPVIEPLKDVVGVEERLWQNVSAYYKLDGKTYALGLERSEFVMRGKKLVLNYTDGSPCDDSPSRRSARLDGDEFSSREIVDHDDDRSKKSSRKKSIVISMQCERDPLAKEFDLKYVATMDECSYFFEGRTYAACPTANTSTGSGSLNPGGVFGVIALIAVLVYMVGGCVYNRAVLQQRGWQQIPNYALWAGILGFFRDLFIILTSSCARFMPSRRGYSRVNGSIGGLGSRGRARGDSSDAENRLIDELNEEWED